MQKKHKLTVLEKDILKEVGTMCAGNATTAFAQILCKKIELLIPSVKVINLDRLSWHIDSHPEQIVVGIHMQILGKVQGNALLVFPRDNAFRLVEILVGPLDEKQKSLTEIGISALKEMGSIMISSYLSALSAFTGISVFPSVVTLTSGATNSLIKLAFTGLEIKKNIETLLIDAIFQEKKKNISGNFFIVFDAQSMKTILKRAKRLIK